MITFKVVKEQHGWAIRMGEGVTTPFWSRDSAIREAHGLAAAIGCHGERTEAIIEGTDQSDPRKMVKGLSSLGGGPAKISGPSRAA
jgi:hypothetical protein